MVVQSKSNQEMEPPSNLNMAGLIYRIIKLYEENYKEVKRTLKGYLRAEDKLHRSPTPKAGVQTSWQPTGWWTGSLVCPGQSWFTVAKQETTLQDTGKLRLMGRRTGNVGTQPIGTKPRAHIFHIGRIPGNNPPGHR